jgi:hypothetical protein
MRSISMGELNYSKVADWMLARLKKETYLYQSVVVYDIQKKFGNNAVYLNENGNYAIHRKILKAFKDITSDSVVWERGERCWRFRNSSDEPGRQQSF